MIAFWFRRDLRLFDNQGLVRALTTGQPVLPVFIFDRHILDKLEDRNDARVSFIHHELLSMRLQLQGKGSGMAVYYGTPEEVWPQILAQYPIQEVYTNRDYEPYAKQRDAHLGDMLQERGVLFKTFKDQVIFEGGEILTGQGTPYHVFTPFSRKWKGSLQSNSFQELPDGLSYSNWAQVEWPHFPTLEEMGFVPTDIDIPGKSVPDQLIRQYAERRNFPAIQGTSRLSHHLRFGTISLRALAARAQSLSDTFLNELIWREFYMMILDHYPRVVTESFVQKYDRIEWNTSSEDFGRWCEGRTGIPIVDAGMRELNATGFMHNRVRMIVASFLTKNLLIDWRWGEAYFGRKLLDYELSSNNGGWQWAASTGTDAAPYFRVFNPVSQQEKFDAAGEYVRKWVPEIGSLSYPRKPMVDLKTSRQRAIDAFRQVS